MRSEPWLHVVADMLGSVQASVAGLLICFFGWDIADPIASVLIAMLVAGSSWTLLRDSLHVLMEGAPRHLDTSEVQRAIESIEGVVEVHDLHLWTITSGFDSLSAHARIDVDDRARVIGQIQSKLAEEFGIEHSTIQFESADGDGGGCESC